MKEKLCISFSGGKTSGMMTTKLLENYRDKYEILITFANTGEENEETLIFVNECDKYWQKKFNHSVVWLEAITHMEHGKGQTSKVVTFETASRNGEPHEQFISKEGIPSMAFPQCSERLKTFAINHYRKGCGFAKCKTAIGIRTDESRRRASPKTVAKYNLVYPLLDWFESDKIDVNDFWEDMPFNLNLEEHQGNCKTCWKKSEKKLWLIALEDPSKFDFNKRMENKFTEVKAAIAKVDLFGEHYTPRRFFRKHKTAQNIIDEAQLCDEATLRRKIKLDPDLDNGCSESCEPYQTDIEDEIIKIQKVT